MELKELVIKRDRLAAERDTIVNNYMAIAKKQSATIIDELEILNREIVAIIDAAAEPARKDKPYGIVTLNIDGVEVKHDVQKKVTWDQAELAKIRHRISDGGDDPAQYIEEKLSVPEKKFQAWPAIIQKWFHVARTEKPGPGKIKSLSVITEGQ